MARVLARCDWAWRCKWKASVALGSGLASLVALAFLLGLSFLWSARRASACSNWRAFWKSPRHSMAVPSQARRYAWSAVVRSSAMTTRFGGGMPLSERQRAVCSAPFSLQWICGWAVFEEVSDMGFNRKKRARGMVACAGRLLLYVAATWRPKPGPAILLAVQACHRRHRQPLPRGPGRRTWFRTCLPRLSWPVAPGSAGAGSGCQPDRHPCCWRWHYLDCHGKYCFVVAVPAA